MAKHSLTSLLAVVLLWIQDKGTAKNKTGILVDNIAPHPALENDLSATQPHHKRQSLI